MDPTALVASLQEAVPGAQLESAPSIDLQTTIYVSRERAARGRARAARSRRICASRFSPS